MALRDWIVATSVAFGGLVVSYLLRFVNDRRSKAVCQSKAEETSHFSEVIFFPDPDLDREATYEVKSMMYKQLLASSRPLARLVYHLSSAEKSLDICLFMITSVQLADAVLATVSRGVRVRLILDHDSVDQQGSQAARFRQKGAFVRSKPLNNHNLMHHKFVVVDGDKLISGSFNWTMQAVFGNKENVIVSRDPGLVEPFVAEFERLWEEVKHAP